MTASTNELENLGRYFRVQHAPEHFKSWRRKSLLAWLPTNSPSSTARTFCEQPPIPDLVPITVQLRNRDLSFQSKQGVPIGGADLYGRITDPGGRVVQTFEDVISRDFSRIPLPVVTGSLTRFIRNPCRFDPDSTVWIS